MNNGQSSNAIEKKKKWTFIFTFIWLVKLGTRLYFRQVLVSYLKDI